WNDTSREVHELFKTTAIDTLKQDKKCQACWYMILSTMSGSTTVSIVPVPNDSGSSGNVCENRPRNW
ncbi:MAG: hypothetical protein WB988_04850, partial [Candidatus Nitrosopolaris sp.]